MTDDLSLGYEVFHHDLEALLDFYVRVLGFEVDDHDPGADYVAARRGALQVGCCRRADAPRRVEDRRPPLGPEIVLRVRDVEAELARVVAAGWPLADELQERPWGMTDFRLFDPTGLYIRVTGAGTLPR